MIKNIITLVAAVSLFACSGSTKMDAVVQNQTEQSSTLTLNDSDLFEQTSVDNSKNYCSGEVSVYNQAGWVVSASDDWTTPSRKIQNTDLALVNQSQRLLFTTSSQKNEGTIDSYLDSKLQALRESGVSSTASAKSTLNGVDYYLITSAGSNLSNWQWVTLSNGVATTFTCGAPKGTNANYDYCLDVMESVQRL